MMYYQLEIKDVIQIVILAHTVVHTGIRTLIIEKIYSCIVDVVQKIWKFHWRYDETRLPRSY